MNFKQYLKEEKEILSNEAVMTECLVTVYKKYKIPVTQVTKFTTSLKAIIDVKKTIQSDCEKRLQIQEDLRSEYAANNGIIGGEGPQGKEQAKQIEKIKKLTEQLGKVKESIAKKLETLEEKFEDGFGNLLATTSDVFMNANTYGINGDDYQVIQKLFKWATEYKEMCKSDLTMYKNQVTYN